MTLFPRTFDVVDFPRLEAQEGVPEDNSDSNFWAAPRSICGGASTRQLVLAGDALRPRRLGLDASAWLPVARRLAQLELSIRLSLV
jgi:hypothetical protein